MGRWSISPYREQSEQRDFTLVLFAADIPHRLFDVCEGADRSVDRFYKCKRIIVLFNDIFKFHQLVPVDHAYDDIALFVAVSAPSYQPRCAVVQFLQYFGSNLVGMGCNDKKFVGRFCAFYDRVSDKAGQETVKHTQAYGFIIVDQRSVATAFGINKIRNNGNCGIDGKIDPEKVELRVSFAYIFSNDVGSPRGRIAQKSNAVNKSADRSCNERGKNRIDALRIVLERGKIERLQHQQKQGIGNRENKGFDSEFLCDAEVRENAERYVENQC